MVVSLDGTELHKVDCVAVSLDGTEWVVKLGEIGQSSLVSVLFVYRVTEWGLTLASDLWLSGVIGGTELTE